MQLTDLQLNRQLYKTQPQTAEVLSADDVAANVAPPPSTDIASGNSVTDVNNNAEQLNGAVIAPGTIPPSTLDIANFGWTQTCVFTVTDSDTIAWASGTFTSADGVNNYSIGAGNTGNMAASPVRTYVYLDINVSTTAYQISTSITAPIGIGKVLIAVCQAAIAPSTTATYALVQATQIVGDNVIANTISAEKMNVAILSAITANLGTITAGSISVISGGNTIGLTPLGTYAIFSGTTGSPQFTVTPAGNAVVASLERNDYHWFTVFESIDGYSKGGAGTQTLNPDHVALATTAGANSESELQKDALYTASQFTWNKRRKIKFGVQFDQNTSQYIDMVTGIVSFGSDVEHFGFRVLNGTLYGLTDDGVSENTISLVATISTSATYILEARLNPGVSVDFYVNGALIDSSLTSIPTGTNNSAFLLDFYIRATTASLRSFKFTFYDFWQQN